MSNMDQWTQDRSATVTPINNAPDDSLDTQDGDQYDGDHPGDAEEVPAEVENGASAKKKQMVTIATYVAGAAIIGFVLFQVGGRLGLIPRSGPSAKQDFSQPVANFTQPAQAAVVPAPMQPQPGALADPVLAAPAAPVAGPVAPVAANAAPDPVLQPPAAPATPSSLPAPTATAPSAPIDLSPVPAPKAPGSEVDRVKAAAEIERLNGEVNELRAKVAMLEQKLPGTSGQAGAQASAKPAAPAASKPVAPKPAPQPKAPATQPQTTAASPKSQPAKVESKATVRSDYRMYAIRDGRAWVKSAKDGEIVLIAADGALPDGTRVKSIHEETGVIVTNAGEIK